MSYLTWVEQFIAALTGSPRHECIRMQHLGGRDWRCRDCGARYVDAGIGLARVFPSGDETP